MRQSVGVNEGGILDHRDAGEGGREVTTEEGTEGKGRLGTAKTGSSGAVTERFFSSSATARHKSSSQSSTAWVESSLAESGGESDSEKKGPSTTLGRGGSATKDLWRGAVDLALGSDFVGQCCVLPCDVAQELCQTALQTRHFLAPVVFQLHTKREQHPHLVGTRVLAQQNSCRRNSWASAPAIFAAVVGFSVPRLGR